MLDADGRWRRAALTSVPPEGDADGEGELERILNAGGEVSRGEYGRPARVWAAGKIGLAMSRSVGDGECKKYGVIPNPEVQRFELAAAPDAKPEGDGDRFVIVASDGVWEFIESQEACEAAPRPHLGFTSALPRLYLGRTSCTSAIPRSPA